jgi:hypothetical protein
MRILHTSDWHIGRTLCGRKRYEEYDSFLTWLAETIQQNDIEVLLVLEMFLIQRHQVIELTNCTISFSIRCPYLPVSM